MRVTLHLLFDTALMAPVSGWMKRAERLLEGHDETPVHARRAVEYNAVEIRDGLVMLSWHECLRSVPRV